MIYECPYHGIIWTRTKSLKTVLVHLVHKLPCPDCTRSEQYELAKTTKHYSKKLSNRS